MDILGPWLELHCSDGQTLATDRFYVSRVRAQNLDYEVVSGARRQERRFDPGENGTVVPDERAKIQKLSTDSMYKLEHGADDAGKLRSAAPALEHVERIQDRMWDDFAANKRLRDKFRVSAARAVVWCAGGGSGVRRAVERPLEFRHVLRCHRVLCACPRTGCQRCPVSEGAGPRRPAPRHCRAIL